MPVPSGSNLGHYRIVEKIGEGGMGEVYAAEDTRLERRVAIKFLPEKMARDAGSLESHPRIAPEEFLRVYVHELGNLLDYYLHPGLGPRIMRHYGDAADPSGDDDTGQQFERCVAALDGFEVLARRKPDERLPSSVEWRRARTTSSSLGAESRPGGWALAGSSVR